MVATFRCPYICPSVKAISLSVYTPILQASFGGVNESPVTGSGIGDDE